jgi:hypothetical protein
MAFSDPAGPPASARRIEELAERLDVLDLGTFREARHQIGLNQRQAKGRFTEDEVEHLLVLLDGVESREQAIAALNPNSGASVSASGSRSLVAAVPDKVLADELTSRGWCCIAPTAE